VSLPLPTGLIAVVTGGRSSERERSLLSGGTALASLKRQGADTVLLDAGDDDFPERIQDADIALLAIAGQWAEDGKLQGCLDTLGVPYTGSGVTASALGMVKPLAKVVVAAAGVPVLPDVLIPAGADAATTAKSIGERLALPVILKPSSEGGSIGMRVCHDTPELEDALSEIDPQGAWFVEPFVTGTPVTAAVLERDGVPVVLPVLETIPTQAEFYDYASKRVDEGHEYRCPSMLPGPVITQITDAALTTHRALRCSGYSRSDFIVTPQGRVVWLEVNTLPGLSEQGNLATMARAGGIGYDHLIRLILAAARRDGGYRP